MADLERVFIKDLNIGDEICVVQRVISGWKYFRHSVFIKKTVKRITPKKTKMITEDGGEYTNKDFLYRPSEEIERMSLVAKSYRFIMDTVFNQGYYVDVDVLSDEDIVEVAKKFVEIKEITDKYIKEDKLK